MTTNPTSPASIYVEIGHKLENTDEYSSHETIADFQRLFHALGAEIRTNQNLEARLKSQETLLDERGVEIFNQSLDIYNLKAEIEQLKGETAENV